jgi:hypothetical protein
MNAQCNRRPVHSPVAEVQSSAPHQPQEGIRPYSSRGISVASPTHQPLRLGRHSGLFLPRLPAAQFRPRLAFCPPRSRCRTAGVGPHEHAIAQKLSRAGARRPFVWRALHGRPRHVGDLVAGTAGPAVRGRAGLWDVGQQCRRLPRQALAGRFRAHHAFLIRQLSAHLDHLDKVVAILSAPFDMVIAPSALRQLNLPVPRPWSHRSRRTVQQAFRWVVRASGGPSKSNFTALAAMRRAMTSRKPATAAGE